MKRRTLTLSLLATLGATVAVQEDQNQALRGQVEELQSRVDGIETYLQSQAKAHGELAKSLQASKEAGFTAGINPNSREVLLKGLGDVATAAQAKVPGKAAPTPEAPRSRRGVRRGQ